MTLRGGLLVLAVIVGASSSVGAQSPAAATQKTTAISGTIHDPHGAVVVGATVIASNESASVFRTTTDIEGKFRLYLLPGDYELSITAPGFKKLVVTGLRIVDSTHDELRLQLDIMPFDNHEPCGYGGDQCYRDEVPKDLTTSPPLIETKIQTRPLPKKPAKKSGLYFL